uniref:Uncharacterized protein n=1 Tax=Anguilla anguilla TaxID=7936 RepID=A0A0E9UF13_ANGAN
MVIGLGWNLTFVGCSAKPGVVSCGSFPF